MDKEVSGSHGQAVGAKRAPQGLLALEVGHAAPQAHCLFRTQNLP